MKRIIIFFLLTLLWVTPVHAHELTAPQPPQAVQDLIPEERTSFGQDLWYIITSALQGISPELRDAVKSCTAVITIIMIISIMNTFPGNNGAVLDLVGCVTIGCVLIGKTGGLIHCAQQTISELSEYAKLLLPVMATATAAQGGITSSAALYAGTTVFDAVLCALISTALVPMIYAFLALSIGNAALKNGPLERLQGFSKWAITWVLKAILYIFTGYITITGVISGSTDQSVLKAARLTISGTVPVVGGILSDASEAVLAGAGIVKNTVGVTGLVVLAAIAAGPFLKIGIQYLLLKLTAGISSVIGGKQSAKLTEAMAEAMGLLLAMTGTECFMLFFSMVCFLKGVG